MMVSDWAQERSDQDWVLDDLERRRNWQQLRHQLAAKRAFLQGRQLVAGDRIGLLMRNRVEYVEWLLAGVCAGLWVVPLNWHLKDAEIAYVMEDSGLRLLIHDEESVPPVSPACDRWILPEDELAFFHNQSGMASHDNDPAGGIMLYTSGTTGRPKGVRRHAPDSLLELFKQWRRHGHSVGLDGTGVHLVTGPLYHAAPMLYALYDLLNGASVLIQPRFDAAQALSLIETYGVTHSHWVPTMLVRALRLNHRDNYELRTLTLVLHGAAPIAPAIKQQILSWWGAVLVEYWGGSESGAVTRVNSVDWQSHPGTVGRALPQFSVHAIDSRGNPLPAGETGLLAIAHESGDAVFSYHQDPEKTAAAYVAPGVFTLGDIGKVDAEGYVYLLDRKNNMVISGGVNIYPAEIEAVMMGHPGVVDIAVLGVPDEEWGERVVAFIELVSGLEASEGLRRDLLAHAACQLASHKLPKDLYFETLPRTDAGKVYRHVLRERFWGGRERWI